ncbi:MAG: hypothetical protein Q4A62_03320 [Eikenella sp.]|nr:hypothetical protein [Eikenella sp.]
MATPIYRNKLPDGYLPVHNKLFPERPGAQEWLGIALICGGVLTLALQRRCAAKPLS